ncbi:MAG: prolyl oligopeptidase family serine peptidase, partial [Armatimonadetes bacterium]|nr:prolyl oligopeptidase family serine peptidase [Armatimonadota bacterium]
MIETAWVPAGRQGFAVLIAVLGAVLCPRAWPNDSPPISATSGLPRNRALFAYDPASIRYDAAIEDKTDDAVVWRVRYTSPVQTEWQQNNTVWATYYQPRKTGAKPVPAVVALDVSGSRNARFCRRLIRLLLSYGIAGAYVELPYHMHRQPAGQQPYDLFLRPDTSHLVEVMRQSVMDVRCMVDWLAQRPEIDARRIAIAGFSLGATVGALTYVVDTRLTAAALVGGGGSPADMIWYSQITEHVREDLEKQGVGRAALAVIMNPVDPCAYATPERGHRVLLINARHDLVVPARCTDALIRALGKPKVIWLNSGHFSMFAHPDKLNREMLNWF